jgi:hypothetical protein
MNGDTVPWVGFGISSYTASSLFAGEIAEIVIYNTSQDGNRTGIESNINGFYEIYTPFTTGLLDDYPTAAAAYSLRALSSTYYNGATPYAIEVRRASDGATQNIGFDIEGNLDVAALRSFCSGTDGTVQTWYDQSGNGNDAEQTATGNQPKIYDSATGVVTINERPAIYFDGSNDGFSANYTDIKGQARFDAYMHYQTSDRVFVMFTHAIESGAHSFAIQDTSTSTSLASSYGTPELYVNGTNANIVYGTTTRDDLHDIIVVNGASDPNGAIVVHQGAQTTIWIGFLIGNYGGSFSFDGNMTEIVIYNTSQDDNRTGIESNINDYYEIYETGLLAEYPGAAAAYSVRQLRSFYNGPAIRVRRDSDDAELDIGFDENGDLDLVALGDFCKYTDGLVKVWYDQSGSGNDAEQTDPLAQPKIYDSVTGVMTENGKPAVQFDGVNDNIMSVNSVSSQNITMVTVANAIGAMLSIIDTYNDGHELFHSSASAGMLTNSTDLIVSISMLLQHLVFATYDGSTQKMSIDSAESTQALVTTLSYNQPVTIGQRSQVAANFLIGKVQEVLVYESDQSANRTNIESNINGYFDIY